MHEYRKEKAIVKKSWTSDCNISLGTNRRQTYCEIYCINRSLISNRRLGQSPIPDCWLEQVPRRSNPWVLGQEKKQVLGKFLDSKGIHLLVCFLLLASVKDHEIGILKEINQRICSIQQEVITIVHNNEWLLFKFKKVNLKLIQNTVKASIQKRPNR